jgi:hypothetical protein
MRDSLRVSRLERLRYLLRNARSLRNGNPSTSNAIRECVALHKLQDKKSRTSGTRYTRIFGPLLGPESNGRIPVLICP